MILMLINSIWKNFRKTLKNDEYFVFWSSLIFYFLLYFNPNNKTLVLLFALFVLFLLNRFGSLKQALFWGLITSFPFTVGKSYFFNLIPASKLNAPNNPDGYNFQFVLTVGNIIAIFMLFVFLRELILKKEKIVRLDFNFICLLFLIILISFSTFMSRNPGLSFLSFLGFLQGLLVHVYARYLIDWRKKNRNILLFLLSSQAIFESVWVCLQMANKGPLGRSIESFRGIVPFGMGTDEDVWRYRPTGTFDHANFVAVFLLPRMLLNFAVFYREGNQRVANYFLLSFVFGCVVLAITLSRSAWISGFIGVLILTYFLEKKYHLHLLEFYKKRLAFAFLLFGLFIFPIFVLPRIISSYNTFVSGGSLATRIELIRESLGIIRQNFFWGTGLGMSVLKIFENNPNGLMRYFPTPVHNWYLLFASEAGVPALLFFIFLINSSLRKIFITKKKDIFSIGIFVCCIVALINGLMQPFLGEMDLFFIFLGILGQ